MIITCPECGTRHRVDPEVIGPNGRTVRCANCAETFFVPAESGVLELSGDTDSQTPSEGSGGEVGRDDTLAPHQQIRQKAEAKKRRGRNVTITSIWLFMLLVLAVLLVLGYFFRHQIVERFPQAATTYKLFGIDTSASGLTFDDVNARLAYIEGTPAVVVQGNVVNRDQRTREAPLVMMSLKDEAGNELASWVVELSTVFFEPGRVEPFATQFPSPPVEASRLSYSFTNDDDLLVIEPPADAAVTPQMTLGDSANAGGR